MKTKQVSVFLENRFGRLSEVTGILGEEGINISAFTIADTSDFGVLRLIVPEPDKAFRILKDKQFSVQTTDVVLVNTSNSPGALSELLHALDTSGVFIEYLYAFSVDENKAVIVIKPSDLEKCLQIAETYNL